MRRDSRNFKDDWRQWSQKQTEAYKSYIKTSAVGLEFGLSIGLGACLGYFFDRYFITSPYGLLVGTLVGCLAAAKRLWLFVKEYLAKNNNDDE
jgi:F0F1-type ATP synthase assembly protein I